MSRDDIKDIKVVACTIVENNIISEEVFTGLIGRYACISIDEEQLIVTLNDEEDWYKVKISQSDLDRVKSWACRDNGSLYVRVSAASNGLIYNQKIGSD